MYAPHGFTKNSGYMLRGLLQSIGLDSCKIIIIRKYNECVNFARVLHCVSVNFAITMTNPHFTHITRLGHGASLQTK